MFYVDLEARKSAKRGSPWFLHCRVCASEIAAARRKPRQDYIDGVKLAAGCADCGIRSPHPEIYDFDHRDHRTKGKRVSAYLTSGTMEELMAEMAQCDVVCANCHRIRTRQRPYVTAGRSRARAAS